MDFGPWHAHGYPDNYTGPLLFAHLKVWLAIAVGGMDKAVRVYGRVSQIDKYCL